MAVRAGQWTDGHDGEVVVFLIGMTVNRWWRPDKWWPVFTAMPRMLAELSKDHDSGLLGYRLVIGGRGPSVVQYWSSTEKLLAYAHDTEREHRKAWRAFNQRARTGAGAVGIWHETYAVPAGAHETIYGNTPPMGLAAATSATEIGPRNETARQRLAAGA
jgi:hypothetical protein